MNVGHALTTAQHIYDFYTSLTFETADTQPENPCNGVGLGLVCFTNPGKTISQILALVFFAVSYGVLTAMTIAFQVVDDEFTLATVGKLQYISSCTLPHLILNA